MNADQTRKAFGKKARRQEGRDPDTDLFVALLEAALTRVDIGTVLADAGYDSEPNHVHAREVRGVRSVMPAEVGRPSESPPAGRWRRLMKQNLTAWSGFLYCSYGQRWQAECGISMIKRRLGASVAARSEAAQSRALMLMAITHNVMILYALWSFLRSTPDPVSAPIVPGVRLAQLDLGPGVDAWRMPAPGTSSSAQRWSAQR